MGRPMILHVVERALSAINVQRAIVATDDRRIFETVERAGYEVLMTRSDHASGSDRLAEVAARLEGFEIIVNVQGDEPLISPRTIERAVEELKAAQEISVVTTCEPLTDAADVFNPDVVKVVVDGTGRALYFSRSPIPYPREAVRHHGTLAKALADDPSLLSIFRKHTGLYVYRRSFLLEYASWPQSELESTESLEQLRVLESLAVIKVIAAHKPSIGVDTAEDLERVRAIFEAEARER